MKEGGSPPQAAEAFSLHVDCFRQWIHRYNDLGLEGLSDKKRPGRPTKLPPQETASLKEWIVQGPANDEGLSAYRGVEINAYIEKTYGISYSSSGLYDLLHRLGLSSLSPRPSNPKGDVEARETFKNFLHS